MPISIPDRVIIATNNPGKVKEISALLQHCHLFHKTQFLSAIDLNIAEPEETADSFAGNATIKAQYYSQKSQLLALSDDSGLCVEAIQNKPGIHSARWAIDDNGKKNFPLAFQKIYDELVRVGADPLNRPKAHFICNLALFDARNGFSMNFEGRVDGTLCFPVRGDKGFGYDPIFIKDDMDKTFAELDPEYKDSISHRAIAFKKLIEAISE